MHNQLKKSIVRYSCVFLLAAFTLTSSGCGGDSQTTTPTTTRSLTESNITTTQVVVEDTGTGDAATVSVVDESNASAESTAAEGLSDESGSTDINGIVLPSVKEQVLLEKSGVVLKAVGMQNHPEKGACLILSVENQSDKNIWVSCHSLAVNNLMVDTTAVLYTVVAKGETKEDILPLDSAYLAGAGISNIGELDMVFGIYDKDSLDQIWTTDIVTMQTSDVAEMDEEPDFAKDPVTVFDQEGICVSFCGKSADEENKIIHLLIENNSEIETEVIFNNYLINDKTLKQASSGKSLPGTRILVEVTLQNKDLEKIGMSGDIKTFGFEVESYKCPEYKQILMSVKVDFSVA